MKIAGIMQVKNYKAWCGAFRQLKELADVTIVLDDKSENPFPHAKECDEFVRIENSFTWSDLGNVMLLMQRAHAHGCDWILKLDDDVIVKNLTRSKLVKLCADLKDRDTVSGLYRELWGSRKTWRSDGNWSNRPWCFLFRNWFGYEKITMPDPTRQKWHTPSLSFPTNLDRRGMLVTNVYLYHAGSISPTMRQRRVQRYHAIDPGNTYWDKETDETGLELSAVPQEHGIEFTSRVPSERRDVITTCRALNAAGAKYVLIGGWAANLYGAPERAKKDVDIVVEPTKENFERVKAGLATIPWGAADQLTFESTNQFDVLKVNGEFVVDLIGPMCRRGIDYDYTMRQATEITVEGVPIMMPSPECLLVIQRVYSKLHNATDLAFLEQLCAGHSLPPSQQIAA